MNNHRNRKITVAIILATILLMVSMVACGAASGGIGFGAFDDWFATLRGELIGNDYNIQEYDNFGNLVFTVHGDKVSMSAETDSYGEITSYVNITVDGYEWQHVGSTLVFAQNGVDMITDFQLPEDFNPNDYTQSTG